MPFFWKHYIPSNTTTLLKQTYTFPTGLFIYGSIPGDSQKIRTVNYANCFKLMTATKGYQKVKNKIFTVADQIQKRFN